MPLLNSVTYLQTSPLRTHIIYLFIASCGLYIQEFFLYVEQNDFSIGKGKLNIVMLQIEVKIQKSQELVLYVCSMSS